MLSKYKYINILEFLDTLLKDICDKKKLAIFISKLYAYLLSGILLNKNLNVCKFKQIDIFKEHMTLKKSFLKLINYHYIDYSSVLCYFMSRFIILKSINRDYDISLILKNILSKNIIKIYNKDLINASLFERKCVFYRYIGIIKGHHLSTIMHLILILTSVNWNFLNNKHIIDFTILVNNLLRCRLEKQPLLNIDEYNILLTAIKIFIIESNILNTHIDYKLQYCLESFVKAPTLK